MDPMYQDEGFSETYSHNPRSRTSSTTAVSTTEGLFQGLRLAESPAYTPSTFDSSSYTTSRPPSSRELASPPYLSPSLPHSAAYLPTPASQHQPHYQRLAEGVLDAEWFEADRPQGTPLLRVEHAPRHAEPSASSPPPLSTIEPGTMSTVALSYDAGFSMGARSAFTWPVMETGNSLMGPEMGHYGSEASLTPPSASRSVTGSPPRGTLTPDQRELKRQRDHARHNSKMNVRNRRTGSSSSSVYSPPVTMADLSTGASSMPVYTTAPPQISLLAEPSSSQYLPSFSPPLSDHNQAGMFASHYPPPSYMTDYGYPTTTAPSLSSHYGRPIMPDPNLGMYSGPPVMGPGPQDASGQVRVVQSRPKPQCWEHGCNGRQFSTFSNLLRHQREKSGQAAKASCPNCGAEFTRTTARNGHLLHDKCKQRKSG
ncbi:hypothetical protein B0T24DRAFT_682115 [Lasiosphaeria ovina]|uniref:Uncharacterized protein n=1 Tax=Lasiosphaeria ovina TaxID=92902 RepID=A0AAE0K095_9PEZI|nr:hypothetical protein B0T24DRAFT_682115 [Lasiosphaeria ovina]